MALPVYRTTVDPLCHRFALLEYVAIPLFIFSDRVRAPQLLVERPSDAEALVCERFVESLADRHGGYSYGKEYHVERYLRESLIGRIAPVSPQLILCYIAERVLGLPRSY